MSTFNFPKITIPKPCHEDWNKMTPDEKGAFCKVCNKSVIDFSNKSAEEAHAILAVNQGTNMCGRFRTDQLTQPVKVEIPLWMLPKQLSPLKAFLVALLMTFGTALFSCTSTTGQMVGKIAFVPDSVKHPKCIMPKGEVKLVQPEHVYGDTIIPPIIPDSELTLTEEIPGDSALDNKPDTNAALPIITITPPVMLFPDSVVTITLGGFWTPLIDEEEVTPDDSLNRDTNLTSESTNENREGTIALPPEAFHLTVLSNPTSGQLNLKLMMNVKESIELDLYDLVGRKLRSFMPIQRLDEGQYDLSFDISSFPSGQYLCVARSASFVQSPRIVLSK